MGASIINKPFAASTPNFKRSKIESISSNAIFIPKRSLIKSGETTTRAGVLSNSSTKHVPSNTSPPANSASRAAARSAAGKTRFGSTPFSKRADASERRPR